jgi:hypothetical protein
MPALPEAGKGVVVALSGADLEASTILRTHRSRASCLPTRLGVRPLRRDAAGYDPASSGETQRRGGGGQPPRRTSLACYGVRLSNRRTGRVRLYGEKALRHGQGSIPGRAECRLDERLFGVRVRTIGQSSLPGLKLDRLSFSIDRVACPSFCLVTVALVSIACSVP